jgi:hypothetical protein
MKRLLLFFAQSLTIGSLLFLSNTTFVHAAKPCSPGTKALPKTLFVPWYQYLEGEGSGKECKPKFPGPDDNPDYVKGVSLIALAILDSLIRISGLIAVGYIIYGAIRYVTSQGEPGGISSAKNTITNAVVGLVIVMLSVGVVQFIGNAVR